MEFPNIGDHCQEPSCNTLDFLPFKCDACKKVFCKEHYTYNKHSCSLSNARQMTDFQVPLCPLCSQPVPHKRNQLPDITMSAHIDRDCKSDPAEDRRRKIYSNKCYKSGCKKKELVPFKCSTCRQNYCIRHRNEIDHDCTEVFAKLISNNTQPKQTQLQNEQQMSVSDASTSRTSQLTRHQTSSLNNAMTEQKALDYALKLSLQEQNIRQEQSNSTVNRREILKFNKKSAGASNNHEETEDEILARVLAESEREHQQKNNNNSCSIG